MHRFPHPPGRTLLRRRWLAAAMALAGIAALIAATGLALRSHSAEATAGPCDPVQATPPSQALQLLSVVNGWRQSNLGQPPPPPMQLSGIASMAAQWFAEDMIAGQTSGHYDQYGRTWVQRLEDCGFSMTTAMGSGEALAGFGSPDPTYGSTPEQALALMTHNTPDQNGVEAPVAWQCAGVGYASNPNAQVGQDTYAWVVVTTQTGPGGWNSSCDPPNTPVGTSTPIPSATASASTTPSPTGSPTPTSTPTPTPTPENHRAYAPMLARDN